MTATVDVIDLYDKLRLAPDDDARARLIAQAFALLETRYPHLDDLVTERELSTTELKLIKEIEAVRVETERVRAELKETELRLVKEIEAVRAELKVELARSHANLLKWSFLFWITQMGALLLLVWRLTGKG